MQVFVCRQVNDEPAGDDAASAALRFLGGS